MYANQACADVSRVWGVASEVRKADEVASKQKTSMCSVTEQSNVTVVVCSSRARKHVMADAANGEPVLAGTLGLARFFRGQQCALEECS